MSHQKNLPLKPGYYWALLTAPTEGTHEGDLWDPAGATWEIVLVWANHVNWDRDPANDDEALRVHVPGVRESQPRDSFQWGEFVADLRGE
jgi:hypothetical protein